MADHLTWTPTEGDVVVWAGQTGTWIVDGYEDDDTVWVHRPGVRMIPVVGRQAGGWIPVGQHQREPEHAELVAAADLRPAVAILGGEG